ncbi:hypothetical protein [Actinopolymorpha singaporensis]|uniref:hypothetical protein n=1 Tax=Actinopolymorpha singaporensis TaxID=117157 RepID=UPI000B82E0AD|nr:hypothetical protein [Actinopolymorpha singaporensis]
MQVVVGVAVNRTAPLLAALFSVTRRFLPRRLVLLGLVLLRLVLLSLTLLGLLLHRTLRCLVLPGVVGGRWDRAVFDVGGAGE